MAHSSTRSAWRMLLLPCSWLYGMAVQLRNLLFNLDILHSESFDLPVISVGNITVGGTGKTPMIEYLTELLSPHFSGSILSRGYKRKTKGFRLVDTTSSTAEVGDEILQIKRKYPYVTAAVDEDRRKGIHSLLEKEANQPVEVILLDDAYQHRYVEPGLSILLIDYNRPLTKDRMLPAGNLREPISEVKRARIVVFTKCPADLTPLQSRLLTLEYSFQPHQSVFFSSLTYESLQPLNHYSPEKTTTESNPNCPAEWTMSAIKAKGIPVLIVAGIASPDPLVNYVKTFCAETDFLLFSDHHDFSPKDCQIILQHLEKIKPRGGILLTTEKDGMRLLDQPVLKPIFDSIFVLPLHIHFLFEEKPIFDQKLLDYVRINKRNNPLANRTHPPTT